MAVFELGADSVAVGAVPGAADAPAGEVEGERPPASAFQVFPACPAYPARSAQVARSARSAPLALIARRFEQRRASSSKGAPSEPSLVARYPSG